MKKSEDKKSPRKNAEVILFWGFIISAILSATYTLAVILIGVFKPSIFDQIEIPLIVIGVVLVSAMTIIPFFIIIEWVVRIARERKKQSEIKKIFRTTDGYFNERFDITKPRNVAVIDQRKDDGAVAVVKVFSKKDRSGRAYISDLELTPEEHKALTEKSIIGSQVIIGVKQRNGTFKAILTRELQATEDELTDEELKQVKKNVHNDTPEHRKTYKRKMKRWKNHFKK